MPARECELERMRWDDVGSISIIVQGPLLYGNVTQFARAVQHWRTLFPNAQIIASISSGDLLALQEPGAISMTVAERFLDSGEVNAALDIIRRCCDLVTLAEPALALPPIKSDVDKPNNVNLQISAAKMGLLNATGLYCLRVRSDLLFVTRQFLTQYAIGCSLPRGRLSVFTERVLISNLYTLNPYSFERMPLHFSDWFHFGRTNDLRNLWAGSPMTIGDATFYHRHGHHPESTTSERLFITRLAVEQHICFQFFSKHIPELKLEYHNDLSSIDLSCSILADNFVVCNLVDAECEFDKYKFDFANPDKAYHCISDEAWINMAQSELDCAAPIREIAEMALNPQLRPFPRFYPSSSLLVEAGRRDFNTIFGAKVSGTLFYGPYDSLPSGSYWCRIKTQRLSGPGALLLRIVTGGGDKIVAERRIKLSKAAPSELEVAFDLVDEITPSFEIVASCYGVADIAILGVEVSERREHEIAQSDNLPDREQLRNLSWLKGRFWRRLRRWLAKRMRY